MTVRSDGNVPRVPSSSFAGAGQRTVPAATNPRATLEQLLLKAQQGTLTPAEARLLSALLDSDVLRDAYTPEQRANLKQFAEGRALLRTPAELAGDLSKLLATELPGRFATDLALNKADLLERAALMRAEKAQRLFEFIVPYAKQLVASAADPGEQRDLAAKLLAEAEAAGFKQLALQPTLENGIRVLRELLKAKSAEELDARVKAMRFDAPGWPPDPPHLAPRLPMLPAGAGVSHTEGAPEHAPSTSKRLGPMLLWNVLHRLRDAGEDGRESAAQREALTRLAVAGGLLLVLIAVIVLVATSL
ncbi:MAG: hypothetical protein IPJ65_35125 [Archangiaceae bacterium]|nr:hypothetical protein [Archangiaceae bacterium]